MENYLIALIGLPLGYVLTRRYPFVTFALYLCSVPLDYGLAVMGVGLASGVSIGRVTLLVLVLVALGKGMGRDADVAPEVRRINKVLTWFVGLVWVSAGLALDPTMSVTPAVTLTFTVLLVLVVQQLVTTAEDLRRLLWMIGTAAMLAGLVGFLQYVDVLSTKNYWEIDTGEDFRGNIIEYRGEGGGFRYSGPCSKPTGYGVVLMGGIPALFFLLLREKSLLGRMLSGVFLAMTCFGLVLSMSRTGLLSAAASIGLMAVMKWKRGQLNRWVITGLAAFALVALYQMATRVQGVSERVVAGFADGGDDSSSARLDVMTGALQGLLRHPAFGVGPQNMKISGFNEHGLAAHDAVSQAIGEWGVLAALALAVAFAKCWKLSGRLQELEGSSGDYDILIKAFLMAVLLQGFGTTIFDERVVWLTIGICTAGCNVIHRDQAHEWSREARNHPDDSLEIFPQPQGL